MYPIQARPGRSSSGLNSTLSVGGDDGAWYDSGWTDRISAVNPVRGFLPVIYFVSNWISFRPNHHLCIYTNSIPYFWFSKRFFHRVSHAHLLLPRFRQMKTSCLRLQASDGWVATLVWPGVAECLGLLTWLKVLAWTVGRGYTQEVQTGSWKWLPVSLKKWERSPEGLQLSFSARKGYKWRQRVSRGMFRKKYLFYTLLLGSGS